LYLVAVIDWFSRYVLTWHMTGVRALLVAAGEQEDIRPFFA
jgi:transposase InsO family protein